MNYCSEKVSMASGFSFGVEKCGMNYKIESKQSNEICFDNSMFSAIRNTTKEKILESYGLAKT